MGGQDCDGSTLPQAPIGSRPIRSDGLPCPSPTDDDRQISSEDRRSVKLRVRPPPAGTHQCHRATSAGSGMMLTVKLRRRLAEYVDDEPTAELPRIPLSPRDHQPRGLAVLPCAAASCREDDGRPVEVGGQEPASNHPKRLSVRVAVVSVGETSSMTRQVWIRKTNASEPPVTRREPVQDIETDGG